MSPSSTGDSPVSASGTSARQFPVPSRDTFSIDLSASTLGGVNGAVNGIANGSAGVRSPTNLKSQRTPSFSREGIMSAVQKRHLSQSSDSIPNGNPTGKTGSDEDSNPLKRRNTDAGVDYPRRRATIAVSRLLLQYASEQSLIMITV
jgi:hypothetical protein